MAYTGKDMSEEKRRRDGC